MSKEDIYTLRQIRVAFSRHLRDGGELIIKDPYSGADGSLIVTWEGFLKELEQVDKCQKQ